MRMARFRTKIGAPTCEERLLRPDRKGDLELWTDRPGEVSVRAQQSLGLNRARAFYRIVLQETGDGTEIEIRSDVPVPAKVVLGAVVVVTGLLAVGGCLVWVMGLGKTDGIHRVGTAVLGVLSLVCGLALYAGMRWPDEGDQQIVEDIIRDELQAVPIENGAQPAVLTSTPR